MDKGILSKEIAKSQDGNLGNTNDYDTFINSRIEDNTKDNVVDCDSLKTDFEYMIKELTKAVATLERLGY